MLSLRLLFFSDASSQDGVWNVSFVLLLPTANLQGPFRALLCGFLVYVCWPRHLFQGPLGPFQDSPRLLMRIMLTGVYHWEAQDSAAALFPDWCPHRGNRTEPGNRTSISEANQRARANGRCSLGIQPRDTSEASCGHGPLTPCTGSNVQVSGAMGGHTC